MSPSHISKCLLQSRYCLLYILSSCNYFFICFLQKEHKKNSLGLWVSRSETVLIRSQIPLSYYQTTSAHGKSLDHVYEVHTMNSCCSWTWTSIPSFWLLKNYPSIKWMMIGSWISRREWKESRSRNNLNLGVKGTREKERKKVRVGNGYEKVEYEQVFTGCEERMLKSNWKEAGRNDDPVIILFLLPVECHASCWSNSHTIFLR